MRRHTIQSGTGQTRRRVCRRKSLWTWCAAEALEGRRLLVAYTLTDLGSLGGRYGEAVDLNDSGQAVVNIDVNPDPDIDEIHPAFYDGSTLTDLGTLAGGGSSYAKGMNAAGQIVGITYPGDATPERAFLYDGQSLVNLTDQTGGRLIDALGINDAGAVIGLGADPQSGYYRAILYQNGVTNYFGDEGSTGPRDLNNRGQVTGTVGNTAFVYDGHTLKRLDQRGDVDFPYAINDAGQLAGFIERFVDVQTITFTAFVYDGGKVTELGTLGGRQSSVAQDINNDGVIVGYSSFDNAYSPDSRAIVYSAGVMQDLNGLTDSAVGAILTSAVAINSQGQILAQGKVGQDPHAFLLTPSATGSVSGRIYNDLNQNGARDPGEPPLTDWVAYADQNDNGKLDSGEPFATAGADGAYTITGLTTGKYRIRELRQNLWTRTQPAGVYPLGYYDITLAAGQATAARDFGNFRPTTPPPPNTPPTAQPDSAQTAQDAPVDINVLANDTDDSGLAPGTVAVAAQPSHGSVAVNPANGHVIYTPAAGFAGTDGFAYTVKDDDGATSAPATVSVTVKPKVQETPPTLGASVMAVLPAAVVGGAKMKGKVTVLVTNQSAQPVSGPVAVGLYVSADAVLDGSDAAAGSVVKTMKLQPGQGKVVTMKLKSLPSMHDGPYRLLARAAAPDGTAVVAATPTAVTIAAPFVDLSGSFASGIAGTVSAGGNAKAVLRVQNLGNIGAKGGASVTLYASTDATAGGADDRLLTALPLKLNLKPGKAKGYRLKIAMPADLAAGSYYLVASVDGTIVGDRDASNNVAISTGPFAVG